MWTETFSIVKTSILKNLICEFSVIPLTFPCTCAGLAKPDSKIRRSRVATTSWRWKNLFYWALGFVRKSRELSPGDISTRAWEKQPGELRGTPVFVRGEGGLGAVRSPREAIPMAAGSSPSHGVCITCFQQQRVYL